MAQIYAQDYEKILLKSSWKPVFRGMMEKQAEVGVRQ